MGQALDVMSEQSQADSHSMYIQCLQNLSIASKILAHHGIVDGFGHVSCRDPRSPKEHFLLSRNLAPALVEPEDIVPWRISDAEPVHPDSPRGFLERCIHSEIYRKVSNSCISLQFDDVEAVIHFHSLSIIPFGLMEIPFKAAYHMASFLGSEPAPIFEIRDSFGPTTDMLIRNTTQGEALASLFKEESHTRPLVLMRGHGATLVAPSLKLAVFRAIYTQDNAKILTNLASLAGGVDPLHLARYLSKEECEASAESNSGQVLRAWDVWCKELEEK
ncbi:aldolase-II domain-containing protein [Favolaschia claudopus]|uniref:Aldolase-II domain-containing protein n=1 Tax=Favolaschia claudopus TaxID=2862362 RepID=A0AAW0BY20_9AGAR